MLKGALPAWSWITAVRGITNRSMICTSHPVSHSRVQVCRETTRECVPAPAATVHHLISSTEVAVLTADSAGFVSIPGAAANHELWAKLDVTADLAPQIPVSMTERYSMYHTMPSPITVAPVNLLPGNVLRLVVTEQKPLMLYHAELSSEWAMDDAFKSVLTTNIISGSNFLYDFTDGQFALGKVTVHQDLAEWPSYYDPVDKADVRLYANDNLQPKAFAGGVVRAAISDTVNPSEVLYRPGFIMMGTDWNRFKKPPADPSLPALVEEYGFELADLKDDWALAFAHEHGHYLLFLFDTYLKLKEDGETEKVDDCVGSAMGWFYELENRNFIHSDADWKANCTDTYAHELLQRNEWQVIADHYPWVQPPTTYTVGPAMPPIPLTKVTINPPANTAGLLGDTTFDLDYGTDPGASPQARGFIIQNGRVIDQGTPAEGSKELLVRGARAGDRFCYTDINQNDDGADQRYRFGCETVAPVLENDTSLFLEEDRTWTPIIDPRPVASNTWTISVTGVSSDLPMEAILYPENEFTPFPIDLQADGLMTSTGEFNLPNVTPAAHIEVRVKETDEETNPARTAWVDFGIGGGTVPGAYWGNGAPVYSSDGVVEVYPRFARVLAEDQFVSVVRLLNTHTLPSNAIARGVPYSVVAHPASLATETIINIHLPAQLGSVQAANTTFQTTELVIHYWNGTAWEPLETTITDEPDGAQLVSANTRGSGIYIPLALPAQQPSLYLPLIARK